MRVKSATNFFQTQLPQYLFNAKPNLLGDGTKFFGLLFVFSFFFFKKKSQIRKYLTKQNQFVPILGIDGIFEKTRGKSHEMNILKEDLVDIPYIKFNPSLLHVKPSCLNKYFSNLHFLRELSLNVSLNFKNLTAGKSHTPMYKYTLRFWLHVYIVLMIVRNNFSTLRNLSLVLLNHQDIAWDKQPGVRKKIIEIINVLYFRKERWDMFKQDSWGHKDKKPKGTTLHYDVFKIIMEYLGDSVELAHQNWNVLKSEQVNVNIEIDRQRYPYHVDIPDDWPWTSKSHTKIKMRSKRRVINRYAEPRESITGSYRDF
ncbi:MAG: hypothetical protein GY714_14160 [Desulfobacterales bacterium]|nr:hypothetical protein [Desulfobacterales bacterium]